MEDISSIHAIAYFNLLKTGSWIEDKVKKVLKPFNLTHAQLNVLHILLENDPQPVSANHIKEKILVSSPDLTRLVDRLVNKEYVARETCKDNRRKIDISLTSSGKDLFLKAQKTLKNELGDFFKNKITEEEAQTLRKILHKIRD